MALSSQALTTVDNAKIYLEIEDSSQDTAIEQLINAISNDIASKCNRTFRQSTQTEKITGSGNQIIALGMYPIASVDSVTVNENLIDPSEYEILAECGELLRQDSIWPSAERCSQGYHFPVPEINQQPAPEKRNISVAYTGGYILPSQENIKSDPPIVRTLPYDLEMACMKMVAIDLQLKGNEHTVSETIGPIQSKFIADYPQSVLDMIERYKKPMIV